MDATCAVYMAGDTVALENIVAIRSDLGVFVGNVSEFIDGVQDGLMDVICAKQRMERNLVALENVVLIDDDLNAFALK